MKFARQLVSITLDGSSRPRFCNGANYCRRLFTASIAVVTKLARRTLKHLWGCHGDNNYSEMQRNGIFSVVWYDGVVS